MKGIVGKYVAALICAGALTLSVQTWAHDDEDKVLTRTTESKTATKKQEKCEKPCKTTKESKTQKNDHSQHQHGNSPDMSQMDHSNMKMPSKTSK